ncbi:alpha amylase C-terminal domain-containing protein [Paramuribaculum intestinale]|uniref:alpha amylase C-terminal domain-containing protein n=1 Tax=Paramuribaculum intestinale TaxID=2094151 RepID=UPI0025B676E6|nr:alpha amylase C-terminal domain-containing protein [Paramuribaculum intestinale]
MPKARKILNIIKNDPWLAPYAAAIEGRHEDAVKKEKELTASSRSLDDFANAHNYFGLHRQAGGTWVFREYAPNATAITLVGDFSGWQEQARYELRRLPQSGVWEVVLPSDAICHGQLYKMMVRWHGGQGERIPAYATRVVQDEQTHIFSAQVWDPAEPYRWNVDKFRPDTKPLLIYECHIGMAQQREGVGTYREFKDLVLPRIHADGYNAIQIMAIQEHPYYGSFGYHVSSFFAASSRFGTPEELKELIDRAHELGIAVIMDIVHSHAVKNEVEGLGRLDGSHDLYFYGDGRREHPAWDSLCFDYGKNEVLHFLLSNCKYWLEEYRFDGFRFDGVTSMLYYSHGLGQAFGSYDDYYNGHQDVNAITYLTLANKLIHQINPSAITIAEEMSGMPGLAIPFKDGGIGFDYRMAMGIPDYWIKTLKEKKDEDWHPTSIFWELTNRRADEKTISYVESHDQALVGDKTVIFRLIDDQMYWHMMKDDDNMTVARGMALHKMIRLVTASTINGGYLNFMGNEFGHPEWIDFPREGNGWSYKYARRQWDLVDRKELKYSYLNDFDNAMISLISGVYNFQDLPVTKLWEKDDDQILAYRRGDFVFVYNFNPFKSFSDYGILTPPGEYQVVLSSDSPLYGGYGNIDETVHHFTIPDPLFEPHGVAWLRLYMPARSAQVLKLVAGSGKKVSKASSSKMSEETKRKPGRPKKADSEAEMPVVKRKPGRPRKTDPEAEAPAAKRKPGRPRKTDPEAEAPAVKRRPGRPKKSEAEKPAGRKPGRPKKEE